jgi:hypothetical protein
MNISAVKREIISNLCWGYICKNANVSVKWQGLLTVHMFFLSAVAYVATYVAVNWLLVPLNPLINQYI